MNLDRNQIKTTKGRQEITEARKSIKTTKEMIRVINLGKSQIILSKGVNKCQETRQSMINMPKLKIIKIHIKRITDITRENKITTFRESSFKERNKTISTTNTD